MKKALTAPVTAILMVSACFAHDDPLPSLLSAQIAKINAADEAPPVLLPSRLDTGSMHLYGTGGPNRDGYDLEVAGAPRCGGANACFIADFVAKKGTRLTGKRFRLASGDSAVYHDISCGGSCAPASIEFVHNGVRYAIQSKVGTTKRAMVALADDAIREGPRS